METALAQLKQAASTADADTRRSLVASLRELADSLESPIGTLHRLGHNDLLKSMVQIGLDINLFEHLVNCNSILTVKDAAGKTGTDSELMKRILRYYNTVNLAKEVSEGAYVSTNLTKNLTEKVTIAGIGHYYGIVSPQYQIMPAYLKETGYKNPTDEKKTAFHKAFGTNISPYQWMVEHPDQLDHFHTYMALRRKIDVSWLSVYPVEEMTSGLTDPNRPLYVNIGGGIGHQCAQFRQKHSDVPGRVILQDLPATVARAMPTPGVENMAHDFFEPQPIKGSKFYFLRGVPHNHPPHKVKRLFENIKNAMMDDSILLVDETVLPLTGVGFVAASIDLTMLGAFASMERTEDEWRQLVESVGLKLVKTYPYNKPDNECVMDIRLP